MQFDMVHCDGPAVLWDPPFVLASVVWAATLSDTGPTGGFFRDGAPLPW